MLSEHRYRSLVNLLFGTISYMIYLNLTKKFSRPDFEVILEDEEIKIWLNCIYGPGEEMPEEYRAVFENEFYIVSVTVSMHSIYILTI